MQKLLMVTAVACSIATPSFAGAPQLVVGECVKSQIAELSSRLHGEPESGTSVTLTNGITTISYKTNRQAARARVGDDVIACLVSREDGCPAGDDRGQVCTVVDLRTRGSWTMPNDEHSCGGA